MRLIKEAGLFGFVLILEKNEENLRNCKRCGKECKEGFLCETKKHLYCYKCQEKFDMKRCKHSKFGEHKHINIEVIRSEKNTNSA